MASTARVTVLFEPAEKAALQSHAAAARVSTGEYIKRAVNAYDPAIADMNPATVAQLEAYFELLDAATKTMSAQVDASIAGIERALDPAREVEARARITREVRAMDLTGVTALFGNHA